MVASSVRTGVPALGLPAAGRSRCASAFPLEGHRGAPPSRCVPRVNQCRDEGLEASTRHPSTLSPPGQAACGAPDEGPQDRCWSCAVGAATTGRGGGYQLVRFRGPPGFAGSGRHLLRCPACYLATAAVGVQFPIVACTQVKPPLPGSIAARCGGAREGGGLPILAPRHLRSHGRPKAASGPPQPPAVPPRRVAVPESAGAADGEPLSTKAPCCWAGGRSRSAAIQRRRAGSCS
jgi:hypothetical protein